MRALLLLFSLAMLPGPGAAAAGCVHDVDRTSMRLASLEREAAAGAPQESWFGEPATVGNIRSLLDGARALAADGKEDACRKQLTQADAVLGDLESKRDEQKRQRQRKTDQIRNDMETGRARQSAN